MSEGPIAIGEVKFRSNKVRVYYDDYTNKNSVMCSWSYKNPEKFYSGYVYMNWETGKITYPEGAVIPEVSEEDLTIYPNFLIVGQKELSKTFTDALEAYLEADFKRRNNLK